MSGYHETRWHENCFGCCDDCTTCLHQRNNNEPLYEGLCKRFMTMGSVRYGMRLGAVSPPPPGAGPRYRSQCCWPSTATVVPGSVSRIPLLTTTPINNFDIISCANRVRMTEDATSEQPQQTAVRGHVLYSTKCLLKSQFKRCTLMRPQIYSRLCEYGDGNGEEDDILNTLDRLPRFRFGGNRANSNKVRDFEKRANEQRLKDLTERLKRGPVPPPRTRHPVKTPVTTPEHSQDDNCIKFIPFRSASFSQVDYSSDDKKYIRKRNPSNDGTDNERLACRGVATLPRSKNLRDIISVKSKIPNINQRESPSVSGASTGDPLYRIPHCESEKKVNEENCEIPEKDTDKKLPPFITRCNTISTATLNTQEKKRDKLRRRKGIYISQWPNTYQATENVIPKFVEDGDFASCPDNSITILEHPVTDVIKLPTEEDKNYDIFMWTSPQEEPLSPEDTNTPPEWPYNQNRSRFVSPSPDEKDKPLKAPTRGMHFVRSDSLSEGELEIAERKLDQISLVPSDFSDSESRLSLNNDVSPCITRRYSKRPLRGPYGQMLEAEMKKPESGRKSQFNTDLKFLEDLSLSSRESKLKHSRSRSSCNNSLDDTPSKGSFNNLLSSPKQLAALSKRKVSADSLVIGNENDQKLIISHQRTTSSPSKLEGYTNAEVSHELLEQLLRGSSEQLATSDTNVQQKTDTRTHVVVELYDNERTYVDSLQILVTKYLEPLKSPENTNLLDSTLVDEIFYQIPFLLSHHQTFLEELKKRLEHWDFKQKIGDVFLEMFSKSAVIESYTNYVNNWKRAREIIKSAQQSKPAFAKFLETTAREHKGKLALDSLLIKPIQKFPKYELLLQRLIKHTDVVHPDHSLLLAAQKEVHDQLLKINCTEREALELEQLREIEGLIEGLIELVSTDRQYLRHDLVSMAAGGGTRKERALFLFSDLLLVTSIKRRSGTIRRPTGQGSVTSTLEANKYKLLMKIALEDLEIVKSKDENLRQVMIEIENLSGDVGILNQINELSWSLHCNHSQLDDLVRDMLTSLNKQLMEQQNSDSQLSCLDLTLNTSNGLENISVVFSNPEKRVSWEESFNEAKQKLAISGDRKLCPELLATVPIRKTRAGLQFTCAAPILSDNSKDVWVCNSDGYVGQVCILSLQPEPTVTSCNGVCNARILCIASVPGVSYKGNNNREETEEHKTIQFDSGSSSDEDDESDNEEIDESQKILDTSDVSSSEIDDIDSQQSTIWLGTEDGCIHVYNASDNIRIKKNKIRLQLGSSVLCIIYFDNRVFVSLANGDLVIYDRDASGGWNVNSPTTVTVASTSIPISKMLSNSGKLWCGCGSTIKVFNTQTLATENNFIVNNDSNKPVSCIVLSGNGLWLSLQNSAIVKCFHTLNLDHLCEVNVAPAVTKMLTSCDDIIRQHKAACLRVTSLLACKDLLWIGTSAGVLLTMPLPHITSTTTKLSNIPPITGVSHGHTGHVRFLTYVEMTSSNSDGQQHRNSYKGKPDQRSNTKMLVISGGDGYEDFRSSNMSEIAGREDSTNHLLLWNI
ncbi:rho guanine nucleotide exchange factor 17-like isoform X2 [Zophobas morio]|uniref:rho guanine nucleotide exchange factor 17-like isoform X2 n=1 Tax=Zophobas morio TaxID=2755281 RepID=UPI003083C0BE